MNSAGLAAPVEAFADRTALADAAAALIAGQLEEALAARGRASFAATGGSTPEPVYRVLARAGLAWSDVEIALTDERWVDPASPDSNEAMVRRALMTGPAAAARLHPLWRPDATPASAAADAEAWLRTLLPFDVALLGMGEDGHIASLFPGNPALAEGLAGQGLCLAVPAGEPAPPQPRISLTLSALLQTRLLLLLITGEAKRTALGRAADGEPLPVRSVLRQERAPLRILWAP